MDNMLLATHSCVKDTHIKGQVVIIFKEYVAKNHNFVWNVNVTHSPVPRYQHRFAGHFLLTLSSTQPCLSIESLTVAMSNFNRKSSVIEA